MKKFLLSTFIILGVVALIWIFRPFFPNQDATSRNTLDDFMQDFTNSFLGLTYEEQQEAIKAGREAGMDVNFNNDGSVTLQLNNSITVINPDGTITNDTGGRRFHYGRNFPINELTQLIPIPSFAIHTAMGNDNNYTIIAHNVTLAQVEEYVEQIKIRGFTIDATENLCTLFDPFFRFEALDSNGNKIEIRHNWQYIVTIIISRP